MTGRHARGQRSARARAPADPARVAAAAVAVVCAAGLAALALVPAEPITAIEVSGARHLTGRQAREATGLAGVPIFQASASEARAALLRIAAVRDARVELALPGAARLTLVEREAVGRWVVGGIEWFVDAEGVLFRSADPTAAPALRVRDDRAPARSDGERVDAGIVAATVRLAKIAPGELRPDAVRPAVRIEPGPNGIVLASGAGWEIRFGGPERIEEKVENARRFLREQPTRRLEYVDVRSADLIVFSPE